MFSTLRKKLHSFQRTPGTLKSGIRSDKSTDISRHFKTRRVLLKQCVLLVPMLFFGLNAWADVPSNVWFKLKSRSSGLVLDIRGQSNNQGAELFQYHDVGRSSSQQFRFLDTGNGYYRIQARHSSQVLDVYSWDKNNGASIVQWKDLNNSNQQWKVERNPAGYYTFVNRYSQKALDVWEKSTDAGARISQYTLTGKSNQQWKLIPADTNWVVAQDGSGTHSSLQSAIDAASVGDSILIKPGTYHSHVEIPSSKNNMTLIGSTGNAADVIISDARCAKCSNGSGGTWGTARSATAEFFGSGLYVRDISIVNAYDEAANGESQAVALSAVGDRQIYENVRILGNQDTLLSWTPSSSTVARQYYRDCYIEGDVDFIFGRGTAVFDRCTIHSLNRGSSHNNGYLTAASTEKTNPYGLLFNQCDITSDAPRGTVYLGRPWPAGGSSTAIGQVLFRDSKLDEAIRLDAWTDMAGLSWKDARLSEYNNNGRGAIKEDSDYRPQMSDSQATHYTREKYLRGDDGWNPVY